MKTTTRPPAFLDMPSGAGRNVGPLGIGAIASPMAVSFREEKLALRATQRDFEPSAETPVTRLAEPERGV